MSEHMFKIQLTSAEVKNNSSDDLIDMEPNNTFQYDNLRDRDNSNSQSKLIYKLIGFKLHEAIRYFPF